MIAASAGRAGAAEGGIAGKPKTPIDRGRITTPIDQSSYEALARFRLQIRRFFAVSQAILEQGGLPPVQYQGMLAIRAWSDRGPLTVSRLAGDLFVKLNTAVELVDRMESAGLVRRVRDAIDRRRTSLILTEQGANTLERFAALHLEEHRRQLSDLRSTVENLDAALAG